MLVKHSLAGVTNFYAGNALTLSNVSESPSERPIRRSPEPTCRTPCRWQSVAGANLPDTSQFWILVSPMGPVLSYIATTEQKLVQWKKGKTPGWKDSSKILKREVLKSSPPSSSLSFRLSVIQSNWWLRRQRRWCSGQSHFRPIVYFHPQVLLSINHNHHPDKDFNDQSQWWWWWWWCCWWSVGVNVVHRDPAAPVGRGGISLASPLVPSRRIPASLGGLKDLQEGNSGNVITQEPLCIWEHAGP